MNILRHCVAVLGAFKLTPTSVFAGRARYSSTINDAFTIRTNFWTFLSLSSSAATLRNSQRVELLGEKPDVKYISAGCMWKQFFAQQQMQVIHSRLET